MVLVVVVVSIFENVLGESRNQFIKDIKEWLERRTRWPSIHLKTGTRIQTTSRTFRGKTKAQKRWLPLRSGLSASVLFFIAQSTKASWAVDIDFQSRATFWCFHASPDMMEWCICWEVLWCKPKLETILSISHWIKKSSIERFTSAELSGKRHTLSTIQLVTCCMATFYKKSISSSCLKNTRLSLPTISWDNLFNVRDVRHAMVDYMKICSRRKTNYGRVSLWPKRNPLLRDNNISCRPASNKFRSADSTLKTRCLTPNLMTWMFVSPDASLQIYRMDSNSNDSSLVSETV